MCPLDITNTVPLTAEFMRQLGRQYKYPISDLAGQCYALVRHQPYYFWDVLTTAYIGRPDIFTLKDWEVEIIPEGPSQGRTKIQPGAKPVKAMHAVDHDQFYAYVYGQWAR
jgi:purine nucleosidase